MTDWRSLRPEWGIVLGSGLAPVIEEVEREAIVSFSEIQGLPVSRVPGHAGKFVFGKLAGQSVVIAQGRVHLYEGWSAQEVTAGVRWMAERGVQRLILTNAAGSLNRDLPPGTWMMLRDHLNLTGASPLVGDPQFIDMSAVYSKALRERFAKAARAEGWVLRGGVYAAVLGPQYETPAEVRMLSAFGADAVGMSTVLEAIEAHALGIQVAGFSCITNYAAGIGTEALAHDDVLRMGSRAAGRFASLLRRVLADA